MKVLVIGAKGQLARSLIGAKKPVGVKIVAMGRPACELSLPETVARTFDLIGPKLVVNTAAYTDVDSAESEPELAHSVNAKGAAIVARACNVRDIPLIHISTDYVFDGSKGAPYVEDDLVAPLGVYGRTKLEGERAVAETCAQHIVLRTAWIVSPFGHNFVKTMLRIAENRMEIGVVADQIGSPTYAPHLASAILEICQSIVTRHEGQISWGTYHAAGTGEATWCDLAQEVLVQSKRFGGKSAVVRPITTSDYPTPARRPANSRLNCGKLARLYGVTLPNWRDGVSECVAQLCPQKT